MTSNRHQCDVIKSHHVINLHPHGRKIFDKGVHTKGRLQKHKEELKQKVVIDDITVYTPSQLFDRPCL